MGAHAPAQHPAQAVPEERTGTRGRPHPLAKRLLHGAWAVLLRCSLCVSRQSVRTVTPSTGEPYAGDPPVRFGGRGGATQCAVPTPISASGANGEPELSLALSLSTKRGDKVWGRSVKGQSVETRCGDKVLERSTHSKPFLKLTLKRHAYSTRLLPFRVHSSIRGSQSSRLRIGFPCRLRRRRQSYRQGSRQSWGWGDADYGLSPRSICPAMVILRPFSREGSEVS